MSDMTAGQKLGIGGGLGLIGAALLGSAIYAAYVRKNLCDANEDGLVTKEEFESYMDEKGFPVIKDIGKFAMTVISIFWKWDEVVEEDEEEE